MDAVEHTADDGDTHDDGDPEPRCFQLGLGGWGGRRSIRARRRNVAARR
jgi:hypothetical protein